MSLSSMSNDKKPSFTWTFPFAASIIAEYRKAGIPIDFLYAQENGREVGRKLDESRLKVTEGRDICCQPKRLESKHGD